MLIRETEIVARFRLDGEVLAQWIAAGWIKPRRSPEGFLFDETDVARTHLVCDLRYDMELGDDEMTMVLSLVDQLHGARALLRAMTEAVHSQPDHVREAILTHVRIGYGPRE